MATQANSGIYEIVNLVNGKRYIGSAVNIPNRWRQHRCELGKERHNPILQSAWRKYGEKNFEFRIIEMVPDKIQLIVREQHYLDLLKPAYNCAPIAGSRLGAKMSPESRLLVGNASKRVWSDPDYRAKMSARQMGKKIPPEQRAKISAANTGRKLSSEHVAKIAANNSARNRSAEHRALMSAHWKGRVLSDEHMAAFQAGRKRRVFTEEQRQLLREQTLARYEIGSLSRHRSPEIKARISASLKGRKPSEETLEKLRGRHASDETRRKMTESQKRRWALRKADTLA